MKPRTEIRRPKLPPILDIDEFDLETPELDAWGPRRMSSDDDDEASGVSMGEWPTELDD